ncbi:hypothetical protein [Psychrobacter urativorans]|nr:hypothetical protein [Psychrobacter urativorans]
MSEMQQKSSSAVLCRDLRLSWLYWCLLWLTVADKNRPHLQQAERLT